MDFTSDGLRLLLGDCLERMKEIDSGSVALIVADPPYHRVKTEAWDRQWKSDAAYLDWLGEVCHEWSRVLKPNGSLYCFASPRMAWGVEGKIRESFAVLNRITWRKDAGWAKRQCKEEQRAFFPASEAIIFAESIGSDAHARGEAEYGAKCDELRGFVFEPLRAYLDGERIKAELTPDQVNVICGFREKGGMAGRKWFNTSQFAMPTEKSYSRIAEVTGCFDRPYEDLRREYEDLRREYEDLRRPFTVSADVPYTDVWTFPTVPTRPGKHSCQKPQPLIEHIIAASSHPGDLVLDPFLGSGVSGRAALTLDRRFVGIEKDERWFASAQRWIAEATRPHPLFGRLPLESPPLIRPAASA